MNKNCHVTSLLVHGARVHWSTQKLESMKSGSDETHKNTKMKTKAGYKQSNDKLVSWRHSQYMALEYIEVDTFCRVWTIQTKTSKRALSLKKNERGALLQGELPKRHAVTSLSVHGARVHWGWYVLQSMEYQYENDQTSIISRKKWMPNLVAR